jgi:vitamin B12 transporter
MKLSFLGLALLQLSLSLQAFRPPPLIAQEKPIRLEGIVVTASRVPRLMADLTSHVTVLEGEELRDGGMTRVVDAIRQVPGAVVQQTGSFGSVTSVYFRGAESDHVLVLVDGVQMNQPGGDFDFSSLVLDNVERIEVVRGPASALYGSDAVAGVIQIISRNGTGSPAGSLSATAGSFGRTEWTGEISGGTDRASYGFSLSHRSTDGILQFNNQHENTAFSGSVRVRGDEDTWARVSAHYTDREFHFPTDGGGKVVDRNAFTFGDELALSLDGGRRLTDRVELRTLFSIREVDSGLDDAPDGPADTVGSFGYQSLGHVRRMAADVHLNLDLLPATLLTVGGEAELESERSSSESLSEYGPATDFSEHERNNLALFTQVVTDAKGLAANLAGRLEDNEEFGRSFTYQVGVAYSLPTVGLKIRSSLGRAVKEPTFVENYSAGFAIGNPELKPETSFSWEVGGDQELLSGRLRLSATFFSQSFQELIQYTFSPPEPGGANFYNVAEAGVRGWEIDVTTMFGPLTARSGYTYLDSQVREAGFDEGTGAIFVEGQRLLRRPRHQLSLGGRYAVGTRASVHVGIRWVGNREDRDFSTWPAVPVELGSYLALDMGATVRILDGRGTRPGVSLRLRGENLLDAHFEEAFGFPAPGRGVYLGAQVSFGGG